MRNLKRCVRVIKAQAMTSELSHICVSQQYQWHVMIETEWKDMRQAISARGIFTCFCQYLQLYLDKTYSLFNEGKIMVVGHK